MRRYQKEIIKLSARQVLLSAFKLALPFFEASRCYYFEASALRREIECEQSDFLNKVKYLKRHGLIESFVENKEQYYRITSVGLNKIKLSQSELISIERPFKWNGKWYIVIFDIPDKYKNEREILRKRLIKAGFRKVQESVYVYPFECREEVALCTESLGVQKFTLVLVADIIQGEDEVISYYIDKKILTEKDLKREKCVK